MATLKEMGWVWKRFPFNGFVIANLLVRNGAALPVRYFAFDTGLLYPELPHVNGATRPGTCGCISVLLQLDCTVVVAFQVVSFMGWSCAFMSICIDSRVFGNKQVAYINFLLIFWNLLLQTNMVLVDLVSIQQHLYFGFGLHVSLIMLGWFEQDLGKW